MSTQRPLVTVYAADKVKTSVKSVPLPDVFNAPVRAELVQVMHGFALKNLRQPYAVSKYAGKQHSAESWGTGRAVSRIPRISGGGTHRSGQGAFGNMCRGGRMFAPTKVFRRWASKVNRNEKRFAIAAAIAASGSAPLVMSRGHKIESTAECPLVVSDDVQTYTKTKQAVQLLKRLRAYNEVVKVKNTRHIRAGKGKRRNRKYKQRKGPLVVYKEDKGIVRAFRNLPGVDLLQVDRLNLLRLAPGGKVGRFIIWTESAFDALNAKFGSYNNRSGASVLKRRNGATYHLPRPLLSNTDVSGVIDSDAVQNVVRPAQLKQQKNHLRNKRKNPLRNFGFYKFLNPLAVKEAKATYLKNLLKQTKVQPNERVQKSTKHRQEREKRIVANFYNKYVKPVAE